MTLFFFSCGKDENDDQCRSAIQMQQLCYNDNAPVYGSQYAAEICTNAYVTQRCY
jgi:hypothetical protein